MTSVKQPANSEVKKTLTVLDRSTKGLSNVMSGLSKTVTELLELGPISIALAQEIEFKQNELNNLENAINVRGRELQADLALRVKEDSDKVLVELLKDRGLVTRTPQEIKELETSLQNALSNTQQEITKATETARTEAKAAADNIIANLEANHKVEIATLQANTASLSERVEFLTQNIVQLQNQIEQERNVRLEIAKAEASNKSVVVNTTTTK